jgi:hypothetical protein
MSTALEATVHQRLREHLSYLELTAAAEHLGAELDRARTHKAPPIQRWLLRHPRFHLHFTPMCASWMTWWNAGSRSSPCVRSGVGTTGLSSYWRAPSGIGPRSGTKIADRLYGQRQLMRSSRASRDIFNEPTVQDTSVSAKRLPAPRCGRRTRAQYQ